MGKLEDYKKIREIVSSARNKADTKLHPTERRGIILEDITENIAKAIKAEEISKDPADIADALKALWTTQGDISDILKAVKKKL